MYYPISVAKCGNNPRISDRREVRVGWTERVVNVGKARVGAAFGLPEHTGDGSFCVYGRPTALTIPNETPASPHYLAQPANPKY